MEYEEAPQYELDFQRKITDLVMSHIDRMNDVCEEDTAVEIINSFTKKFDPIFDEYLNLKFPNWNRTKMGSKNEN